MIAVDTNLLVYAHRAAVPEHRAARRAIETVCTAPHGWGIALPSLAEFYGIVTHPAASGRPSSPGEAIAFVNMLCHEGGAQVFTPAPDFAFRLLETAAALELHGPRIFDLQIALCALEAGARELWTHDRQFVRVPGLHITDPLG
jgi:hypothetical protein